MPSDAPDDYAALRDLKEKPLLREKFGITAEMVEPFDVVEIIDASSAIARCGRESKTSSRAKVPEFGRKAAVFVVEEMKIASQNDKEKLAIAKEKVYKLVRATVVGLHAVYESWGGCRDSMRA